MSTLDTASFAVYSLLAVGLLVAVWYGNRKVRFWTSLRKLDRRQRIAPEVTVTTWALTLLGFAPFAYYRIDTGWPFVAAGVGFVLGLQMLGVYASNRDWYRAHGETPRKDARMVGYEPVVVSGEVVVPEDERDIETLEAPISGQPCVAYLGSINERRWFRRSRGTGYRSTLATLALDEGGTPFYVDDGTDRILVDPSGADLLMSTPLKPFVGATHTTSTTVEAGVKLPEHLATYSSELDVSPNRNRERVYNELRMEPGDEVYVIGKAEGVTGTEYPSRATHVVSNGDGNAVNVIVQESYPIVDEAFERFESYYLYGAAIATVLGYAGMILLTVAPTI